MEINESKIFEDPEYVNENLAMACLLAADICYMIPRNGNIRLGKPEYTAAIFVNASDIFAWGSADGEPIKTADGDPGSEIIALYKCWKENEQWGFAKWLCLKRNEQPQRPVKEKMIESGVWNDQLEALPENYYDSIVR